MSTANITKTVNVEALRAHVLAKAKKGDRTAMFEYNMAFCTNGKDPSRTHVDGSLKYNMPQKELDPKFPRDIFLADAHGASKLVYWHDWETGMRFNDLVVKVERTDKDAVDSWGWEIQCKSELKAWETLAKTPDADLLCPILKCFEPKSDHPGLKKSRLRMMLITQKAEFTGSLEQCLQEAYDRNTVNHCFGAESKSERRQRIESLCNRMGWRDIIGEGMGGGHRNSGVIYDYHDNCYKAVIIDYAL